MGESRTKALRASGSGIQAPPWTQRLSSSYGATLSRRRLRAGWRGRNLTDREIRFRVQLGGGEGCSRAGAEQRTEQCTCVASVPAGDPWSATRARRPLPWTRNYEAGLVRAWELQPCHRVAWAYPLLLHDRSSTLSLPAGA